MREIEYQCPVFGGQRYLRIRGYLAKNQSSHFLILGDLETAKEELEGTMTKLAEAGFGAYTYTPRHFHENEDKTLDLQLFREAASDLLQACALIRERNGGHPPHILAFGLSTLFALRVSQKFPRFIGKVFLCNPIFLGVKNLDSLSKEGFNPEWGRSKSLFLLKALADLLPNFHIPPRFLRLFFEKAFRPELKTKLSAAILWDILISAYFGLLTLRANPIGIHLFLPEDLDSPNLGSKLCVKRYKAQTGLFIDALLGEIKKEAPLEPAGS